MDANGTKAIVQTIHDDIGTLLEILDPPKPEPKKLLLKKK